MLLDVKRKLPSWRNTEITFFLSGGLWCCMRGTEQPMDFFFPAVEHAYIGVFFAKSLQKSWSLKPKAEAWISYLTRPELENLRPIPLLLESPMENWISMVFNSHNHSLLHTICVFKTILNTYANHKTPCSNKGSNTQTLLTLMFAVVCVFAFLCVF